MSGMERSMKSRPFLQGAHSMAEEASRTRQDSMMMAVIGVEVNNWGSLQTSNSHSGLEVGLEE
jgi:hypothetical protein